ncbi:MAG: YncE family protein, partial [Woeseiaceae bacterium]
VAEGTQVDFQVGANAYLYGGRFMSYLAHTWSPEKLVEWVKRTDGSHRWYEKDFQRVFGLPLDEAWQHWIEFEREFQQANLDRLREYPTTEFRDLSGSALGSVSRAYYDPDRNSLIAGIRYPGVVAHIGELSLETGDVERLRDIKIPMIYRVSSVAYDESTKTIFYTADNYAYRDLMAIDLHTKETRMLMEDARIGEIVFNAADQSVWGVRHLHGYASIVRIPHPYTEWQLIETLPYGNVVYDMDISPDGRLLSGSFGDIQGKQVLRVFRTADLRRGEFQPVQSFDFNQAVPEGFVFSPDGRFLFGSSYFTGVSNIFRYEIETGDLQAVSNSETGFFRPLPLDNENLIVFQYTGEGFKPAMIEAQPLEDVNAIRLLGTDIITRHPHLLDWRAGFGETQPAESRITSQGTYVAAQNLGLESWFPIVLGFRDSVSLGAKFNFTDPIRLDMLNIGIAHTLDSDLPGDERVNVNVDYKHTVATDSPLAGTWRFGARRNHADFYDLFGPTRQSRKGNRFYAGYEKTLLFDNPRRLALNTELNFFSDLDELPRFQDIPVTFDELATFDAVLSFEHVKRSLGAVDGEKGLTWDLAASLDFVDGDAIPKVRGNLDFGFALPWRHSSLWFRNSAGIAFGETVDEFAKFFFGGFGNNYVDRGEIKRYRKYYAMPGFELSAIPGRNFIRNMIEWNLPPIRFERTGTSKFYLSWARPAIFVSYLQTNLDQAFAKTNARSVGAQIDFRFTVMARMDMTLSAGYARAYGPAMIDDEEFMISLKIM